MLAYARNNAVSKIRVGNKILPSFFFSDFKNAIEDVLPDLKDEGLQVFYLSDDSPSDGIEALLGQVKLSSDEPVPASYRANVTIKSTSVYIFTSGTTGKKEQFFNVLNV